MGGREELPGGPSAGGFLGLHSAERKAGGAAVRLWVWSSVGLQCSCPTCAVPLRAPSCARRHAVVAAAHAQGWSIAAEQQPSALRCTKPAALARALSAFVQLLVTQSHVVPSNRYFPELNHPKKP